MSKIFQAVKGMPDIIGTQAAQWRRVEQMAFALFAKAHFLEMRTPVLEDLHLFERGIGTSTDIVEKEMYTLVDRNERALALRPEGTAPIVRAYLEHFNKREGSAEKRLCYFGPMFRYERPQKGRFRQFYQFGAEILGVDDPTVDAELIQLIVQLLEKLAVQDYQLLINSLGTPEVRQKYKSKLLNYLDQVESQLCEKCQSRKIKNPLRVLDCKTQSCVDLLKQAPSLLDDLDDISKSHFDRLQNYLSIAGIPYQVNPQLVRGLDYYDKTAFEFTSTKLGAQNAFAGGGRYNNLVQELGGPAIPAVGFALGMERLMDLVGQNVFPQTPNLLILIALGEEANKFFFKHFCELRNEVKLSVMLEGSERSLKAKLKMADRQEARYVLILGEQELQAGLMVLKDMKAGTQQELSLQNWINQIKLLIP